MTRLRPLALIAACVLGLATAPALAGSARHDPDQAARIDLLPGWRTADGSHMAALRVQLGEGWKTYWRAPGDAGLPPEIDWSGSRNLDAISYHWPVPEVFFDNGMRSIGYKHELILPIRITPKQVGAPIRLKARLTLGICRDICMPLQARVALELPRSDRPDPRIQRALNLRPDTAAEAGVEKVTCQISAARDGLEVTARLTLPRQGAREVVVMETPNPEVWVSEADVVRSGATLTASADLVPPPGSPLVLDRSTLRFTVLSEGRGVDILGCAP